MKHETSTQLWPMLSLIALPIIAVLLTLLVVEAAMRIFDYPFNSEWIASETKLARFDSTLGWVYIPDSSQTQEFGREHLSIPMHFDEIGARASSPDRVLDAETPTIILAGGSYTMGHAVTYEDSFAGQLEAMSESRYQIVNLGVQAFGTDQSLLRLQRHFDDFNTKAVVYTFIDQHIRRNENYDRRIIFPNAQFLGTKPRFVLQPGGDVVLDKFPVRYEDYSYSRIWATAQRVNQEYGKPPSFDLTGALIRKMKAYVESKGAAFVMVHWRWKNERSTLLDQNLEDVETIDTMLGAPAGWAEWRIIGDGHPEPRAHSRVASLIMERIPEPEPTIPEIR
jgi:hypothetical protein